MALETQEQMEARLLGVIAESQFDVLADDYIWQPMEADRAPARDAIACVRDGSMWHEFVPAPVGASAQRYRVVSFHFEEGRTPPASLPGWPPISSAPPERARS